jgi:hypothetical protein
MHALNTAPRGSRQSPPGSSNGSNDSSPSTPQGAFPDPPRTQTFTEDLLAQVSQLSKHASSLPPSFIVEFAQKCFVADLKDVDFPQALTGLDYLKDLETRRRREVAAAMSRLDVGRQALDSTASGVLHMSPAVLEWVKTIEDKERRIDALYTQVFVGIRRWILINEFSLLPFHKHNCLGMLNTLYPPLGLNDQPTSALSPLILKEQRAAYFKYISSVERNGPRILGNLMQQGKNPGDDNGWPAVVRGLGLYMQLARSMIAECELIYNANDLSRRPVSTSRHQRKADSGISFGSTHSIESPLSSPVEATRPTSSSSIKGRPRTTSSTTLEKIAKGLRTLGRSRTDVTEMVSTRKDSTNASNTTLSSFPQHDAKPGMLRKMRSLGSLNDRKTSSSNLKSMPAFDVEEMRRQRAMYEKRNEVKRLSHEV